MAILPQTPSPLINDPVGLKLAAVEARLAALEAVLKIGPAGDVILRSQSTLSIEASSTMVKCNYITMLSASDVYVKCGATVTLEAGSVMAIKAWSMGLQASGPMVLKGSMISIN